MSSPLNSNKFRPYFTPAQLAEIIRCCKLASSDIALLSYLESFNLKITRDVISPALQTKPSLESRLGLASSTSMPEYSPAELHSIWLRDPNFLTPKQLILVQQYRWENELMTPEEARSYEDSLMS